MAFLVFWYKDMISENNQQQNLGCKSLRMVRFEISHLTPVSRSNRLSIKVPCLECFRMGLDVSTTTGNHRSRIFQGI